MRHLCGKHEYQVIHRIHLTQGALTWPCFTARAFSCPSVYRYYAVPVGDLHRIRTRDILYVKGIINGGDSLHLLINHWPSRWEGALNPGRRGWLPPVSLRHILDSLSMADNQSRILVAGDFNDEVPDVSLRDSLGVQHPGNQCQDDQLYFPCDSPDARTVRQPEIPWKMVWI